MQWRFKIAVFDSRGECLWPLLVLNGVESVQKIKTGLECDQWLLSRLRNTVFMQTDDKRRAASEIVVADLRS